MPTHGQFIGPASPLWRDVVARAPHDFYHLPEYSVLAAGPDETPLAFHARSGEHEMLLPFMRKPLPTALDGGRGLTDAISPYGYPGPIWSEGAPAEFQRESLESLVESMRSESMVSGFFRLHTLLNHADQFTGVGELVLHGPTVYIDLTLSEDQLWTQTRRGHRREILGLREAGYVATIDHDWARLDDFMLCYNQTMDRVNASAFYYFPKSYFLELRKMLGDRASLCVVDLDGEVACAGIATVMGGIAQYHLSATAAAHLQAHPSKLMLNFLSIWLKQQGASVFHIGGGVGSLEDKLHLFKSGFSPLAAEFRTWRIVADEDRYAAALDQWSREKGMPPVDRAAFFPQYRA